MSHYISVPDFFQTILTRLHLVKNQQKESKNRNCSRRDLLLRVLALLKPRRPIFFPRRCRVSHPCRLGRAIQEIQIAAESKILPKLQKGQSFSCVATIFRWCAGFAAQNVTQQESHFIGGGVGATNFGSFVTL